MSGTVTVEQFARSIVLMSRPGAVLTPAVKAAVVLLDMGHAKAARDLLAKALEESQYENYKGAKS